MQPLKLVATLTLLCTVLATPYPDSISYLIDQKYLDVNLWKSPTAVITAIEELQKRSGILVTGRLNSATANIMKLRHCGIEIKTENYVEEGSRWNTSELTYRISNYTHDMSKYKVDRITARSFKFWSDVSTLKFTHVKNKIVNVDIEILFTTGDHGDGLNFDGIKGQFAHAFFPQFGGDAHFDDAEYWDEANNYEDSVNLLQVMTHEFGHSLGLKHSEVHDAVMFAYYEGYNPYFKLHEDDIKGIQALYGGPNDTYTMPAPVTEPPYSRCEDGKLDAISFMNDGRYFAFRRGFAMEISLFGNLIGLPRPIGQVFPGIPDDLDAVVTWRSKVKVNNIFPYFRLIAAKTFFFKGDTYWTRKGSKITGPRNIDCGFQGIPDNVDAVFMDGSETIFVKGDLYYRYIRGDESFPAIKKSDSRWRYVPSGLDAAFFHPYFLRHYFFIGKQYYRKARFSRKV